MNDVQQVSHWMGGHPISEGIDLSCLYLARPSDSPKYCMDSSKSS